MIRHGSARRFHDALGIDAVMRGDRCLQRRVAVAVVTIDFESPPDGLAAREAEKAPRRSLRD